MTSTASSPVRRSMIDVRCDASLGAPTLTAGRCQLFVGHDGPHAILYADRLGRHIRTWRGGGALAEDDGADMTRLPWMYGCPTPAWIANDPAPDSRS